MPMTVHGDNRTRPRRLKPAGPCCCAGLFLLPPFIINRLKCHGTASKGVGGMIEEPGPGAGFATREETLPFRWTPESFYLGATAPEIAGAPSFEVGLDRNGGKDDRGVFIVAGAGGGKGVSLLINNLIGWPGGAVCLDVKGELASLTAIRRGTPEAAKGTGTTVRHFLGQQVAVLDPMGDVKGPARIYRTGYNPLAELDPAAPGFVSDVRTIATALVVDELGAGKHFTDMAAIITAGVLEAVMVAFPKRLQNLVTVRNVIAKGLAKKYLAKAPSRPLVMEALGALTVVGEKEGGGFHTTLVRQWAWLADPRMQHAVMARDGNGDGFSLQHIVQSGGTVYLCLPPDEMETHKRWLRLMLGMALRAKIRQGVYGREARQTLFVVDEMPVLGTFDLVERSVGYLRGYGVKAVTVVQNIGQLKALYQANWQTFLGNTAAVVAFSMNDHETAKHVSEGLGSFEFMEQNSQESESENFPAWTGWRGLLFDGEKVRDYEARGGGNRSSSRTTARKVEPVLRPEQVRQRTARDTERMIVSHADGRPILLARVPFHERFSQEWYEHEANIARIESLLGNTRLTSTAERQ